MSSFLGLTSISYLSRTLFEKSSVTAKLFFAFLLSLNLYLILVSESIQGVGVLLAGTTVLVTIYIRHKFSQIKSLTFLFVAMFFGSVSLLGTAGMGPFSAFRQDTVLFRIDYWSAAVRMIVANPLNGIGIDSYGDYYRQFRSLEAVARTGPQRVTNTAHNVFLDVFASAGLIAGALFLLIMVLTLLSLLRGLNSQINSPDFHALGAMWSGFIVFCLISINQIGVGIWGFIFTGLLNGFVSSVGSETTSKKLRTKGIDVSLGRRFKSKQTLSAALGARSSNRGFYQLAVSFSLAITIFVLTLAPNVADARFLAATRSQNLDLALEIITNHGIQDFHTEQLIVRLAQQGRVRESLNLALGLSQRNSQNWPAWVQVVSNQLSTRKQQFDAANNLLRLDPKNELLRRELSAVLSP